jgi:hypothetical protein
MNHQETWLSPLVICNLVRATLGILNQMKIIKIQVHFKANIVFLTLKTTLLNKCHAEERDQVQYSIA